MSAILASVIPALLPAIADGVRSVFNKITGNAGAKPANVSEVIQLMQAETEKLKALATMDAPSEKVHAWVADVRALQRPVVAGVIIFGYMAALAATNQIPTAALDALAQYAQMVTFYLFGDRSYMYLKSKR